MISGLFKRVGSCMRCQLFLYCLRRKMAAPIFLIFLLTSQVTLAAPIERLLILGNSITWRTPSADLEWAGNWGMAASSQASDFSHVLGSMLESSQNGQKLVVYPRNISDLEISPESFDFSRLGFVKEFRPSAVVVFLGDNVKKNTQAFEKQYKQLLSILIGRSSANVYCVSTWWVIENIDNLISKACVANGGKFINIKGVSALPGMKADSLGKFSNPGVAAHPSDEGMKAIAAYIFDAMTGETK